MTRDKDVLNALLAKLYSSLAAGDAASGQINTSTGYYLSIVSPGFPLAEADLAFLSRSRPALEDVEAASAFAELANNLPPSSGLWKFTGSYVWDEYQAILQEAVLPLTNLSAEESERLSTANSLLWIERNSAEGKVITQTPLLQTYEENRARYETAQLAYNARLADLDANPNDANRIVAWQRDEPIFKSRIDAALAAWASAGRFIVESAQATVAQLTGRDPFLAWSDLRQRFQSGLRANSSGSSYYLTSAVPTNFFLQRDGWTKISLTDEDIRNLSTVQLPLAGGNIPAGYKLWGFRESSGNGSDIEFSSSNASDLEVSLEVRRVALRRSWLESSIFSSRGWKLPSIGGDLLSDGKIPPGGRFPLLPTELIVVRNVFISMNLDDRTDSKAFSDIAQSEDAFWGPFRLRGGSLVSDINQVSDRRLGRSGAGSPMDVQRPGSSSFRSARRPTPITNPGGPPDDPPIVINNPPTAGSMHDFTREQNLIRIPGLQLVGLGCMVIPLCPNPDPSLPFPQ